MALGNRNRLTWVPPKRLRRSTQPSEFIEGETLQEYVSRQGPVPVTKVWEVLNQAAQGLRAAAERGIIHRDIKPSNLMITPDGLIKVIDFGISKLIDASEVPMLNEHSEMIPHKNAVEFTRVGALIGTPQYMSPEQASGQSLDFRSDIYSLGLTAYYLLLGKPPYAGTDSMELMIKQCTEPLPSLQESIKRLTPNRRKVLERLTSKDREDRFQSYDELISAL